MTDYQKFKLLFSDMEIDYSSEPLSTEEARELSRQCAEPLLGKTSRYILVGSTYFHFDFKGNFLGVESSTFEPRKGVEMPRKPVPPPIVTFVKGAGNPLKPEPLPPEPVVEIEEEIK